MNHFSFLRTGSLIAATALLSLTATADAQQSPYLDFNHPSVSVDLSVIEDSGYGPGGTAPMPGLSPVKRGKLIVPGARAPASMLHVAPVGGTAAASARSSMVVAPTPRPVIKAPAPQPQVVAKAEPKTAPPAAPAPKKLQAPEPAVEATAETAPPPVPIVAKAPKVTPAAVPAKPEPVATKATEQASLPAAKATLDTGLALQVVFTNDATRLPAEARNTLKALADKIKGQDGLRLQLMAYAGGDKLSASLARRLSLSRALSVRSFLIENGIRSTRIDVRALGNKTAAEPLNRVDLNITER